MCLQRKSGKSNLHLPKMVTYYFVWTNIEYRIHSLDYFKKNRIHFNFESSLLFRWTEKKLKWGMWRYPATGTLKDTFTVLQTKHQLRLRQKPRKCQMPFALRKFDSSTLKNGWLVVTRLLFYWVLVTFSGANSLFNFRGVLKKNIRWAGKVTLTTLFLSDREFG